jgi:hypothetical protein
MDTDTIFIVSFLSPKTFTHSSGDVACGEKIWFGKKQNCLNFSFLKMENMYKYLLLIYLINFLKCKEQRLRKNFFVLKIFREN